MKLSPNTSEILQGLILYFFQELDADDLKHGAGDELVRAARELGFYQLADQIHRAQGGLYLEDFIGKKDGFEKNRGL